MPPIPEKRLPLPERHPKTQTDGKNPGLYFNKFVDKWPPGFLDGLGTNKSIWLKKFAGKTQSTKPYAQRIAKLADKTETLETTGPFVTGMGLPHAVENGFLWHHTLGCPYLSGSSVKGMIRAWVQHWLGENDIAERLFGSDNTNTPFVGSIIIHDAIPVDTVDLYCEIITPHAGDWRITKTPEKSPPADWVSPNPIPFLAIREGARFQFALSARQNTKDGDLDLAFDYLKEALDWIGAGAKTGIGFGRFADDAGIQKLKEDQSRQAREFAVASAEAVKNAPPAKGDTAEHDEWGLVDVLQINGDTATIYSRDEAEETDVPLSELRKR